MMDNQYNYYRPDSDENREQAISRDSEQDHRRIRRLQSRKKVT